MLIRKEILMGVFLVFVTFALELAGAAWSYYYGTHVTAGLAGFLNETFGALYWTSHYHLHVTVASIGWAWVTGYVLLHIAAMITSIKSTAKKRLTMGRPGLREIRVVDQIYQELINASPPFGLKRVSHLAWPRSFDYAPGYGLTTSFLGLRLIIDEGLFTHRCLKPLLAQQLFSWNSGDVWLRAVLECLQPLIVFMAPLEALVGLPVGIGPLVTFLLWKKYWRDRVYAGDVFAARLGQVGELIEAIDTVVRPRERRGNLYLRESPYAAERIDRLMRLMPAGYSRAYAKTGPSPSGGTSFGGASWASGSLHSERASFGSSSSETRIPPEEPASSEKTTSTRDTSSEARAQSSSQADPPESNFSRWNASRTSGFAPPSGRRASQSVHQSQTQRKRSTQMRVPSESVTLILKFADSGWHVLWRTPSTKVFWIVLEEFKDLLDLTERYWDPEAFDENGGWWVAYGALGKVGHLFSNYEEQLRRARERFAREQEQERARETSSAQKGAGDQTKQQNKPQKREEEREEIKLPRTSQEAFAILALVPPVSLADVKRAYRAKALKCHPDRGGSHAQMVVINAAFELAQKVAS
jgi:hypothetical protein